MREMQESYSPGRDEAAAVPRRKLDADDDEVCVPEPRRETSSDGRRGGQKVRFNPPPHCSRPLLQCSPRRRTRITGDLTRNPFPSPFQSGAQRRHPTVGPRKFRLTIGTLSLFPGMMKYRSLQKQQKIDVNLFS